MVMGIVNVTDDSFYDGGKYINTGAAVEHALRLVDEGADVIDIGGCSSRPGSKFLPPEEEAARVAPVISELAKRGLNVPISIDTVWSSVAGAAIDAGARWINDISAGRIDPKMPATAAANPQCVTVLTHSRGTPHTMQENPKYADVTNEVVMELAESVNVFLRAGVNRDKIVVDPGFGFAKDTGHNLTLLRELDKVVSMGYPLLAGLSRKSFIGAITNRPVEDRLPGTLAATSAAYRRGAKIFRVHDVKETVDFLKALAAVIRP
ncbi:MAG: dihydropteroate synthase [Chitinispirillales bacterium]|jgi:dihydropteroate synthase|nr:dihydropteroate synthase [Chitinispirillales bacterium]